MSTQHTASSMGMTRMTSLTIQNIELSFAIAAEMASSGSHETLPPDDERFLIDLEFIQNLSNPKYLSYLAQNKYFQDASFMKYLEYLRYFKDPQYLRHLLFPTCLCFLDALIDNSKFRQELLSPVFIEHIHAQQGIKVSSSASPSVLNRTLSS